MKKSVLHVGMFRNRGGASIAMERVHEAVQAVGSATGYASKIFTADQHTGLDKASSNVAHEFFRTFAANTKKNFQRSLSVKLEDTISIPPLLRTGNGARINMLNPDIVTLHWLGSGSLSISEILEIRAPIVWRLPDLWPVGSIEHYPAAGRLHSGYSRMDREVSLSIRLILRFFWLQKKRLSSRAITVVCPSRWTLEHASASQVFDGSDFRLIPNPLDTNFWAPSSAELGNFPSQDLKPITLLFGAASGISDSRKGWKFFDEALKIIDANHDGALFEIRVFGADGEDKTYGKNKVVFLGKLGPRQLRNEYRKADVFVATPYVESFGQTVTEAQSCGTPVIGTAVGGLLDTIAHGETGILVEPGNVQSLADAILSLSSNVEERKHMSRSARQRALRLWSYGTVGLKYASLYDSVRT